ncbi:cytochrome b2, mitochondrial precursor [Blyttiomyces helicus]|uniref:L-lactate dehydrogenase (cytochrome) n=1 Tax=Blyttiomyces helicus TaxID=388810 RepID=A0A4P9WJ57_9FUNG|nr:cytochrome b2, mitochondrial precursor [Blyttiomyces helicus]RKO91170.1 cytochrome b2, mitochondrial precursor [Blyttiomyces helicus]|eukprot:RKO91167.1 cytochrome b2, mitochondrial precursor [Blyttiomyces helicus]
MPSLISYQEVAKHNSREDCWVIIHGNVYDLSQFLAQHPGGVRPILKQAGKDATKAFEPIHPRNMVDQLPAHLHKGAIDPTTLPVLAESSTSTSSALSAKPPLSAMFNSFDFESVARQTLHPEAWAYYSSGADDELTLQENHAAFHRIWLRPRVLVNVKNIDMGTTFLGTKTPLPVYITATALGKLGHPEGEVVLTRAAGRKGLIQMMPTLGSCSVDEMADAKVEGQTQWFQLYVNGDRSVTEKLIRRAESRGAAGLFITVDAPQLGRREKDMRTKFVDDAPSVQSPDSVQRSQGAARAISTFIDPSLAWSDIAWFKSITRMPIVLKGIQSGDDAVLAARAGVAGIVVSNHGGRQLDTARSGIEALAEVMNALRAAGLDRALEVYVDGGFRRGSDIFKALAMGARGVGLGRPWLYAMSSYGQDGVERLVDLLADELAVVMRLMGTPTIADIRPEMVILKDLASHAGQPPRDALSKRTYEPLDVPGRGGASKL